MTDAVLRVVLDVTAVSAGGVQVVAPGSNFAFWLPRVGHVTWSPAPEVGAVSVVTIPHWLAVKHRQLLRLRDVASERFDRNTNERTATMADRDMSGSLSKNTRKEKPSHADYNGSIVIEGRKFWLNGWVKDGEKGKFLSLSARAADEDAKPKSKPVAAAIDDLDSIPFAPEWR